MAQSRASNDITKEASLYLDSASFVSCVIWWAMSLVEARCLPGARRANLYLSTTSTQESSSIPTADTKG